MLHTIQLKLLPLQAASESYIKGVICTSLHVKSIYQYSIIKKSIDARSSPIWVNLTVQVQLTKLLTNNNFELPIQTFTTVKKTAKQVIIIGAGPAGLFAALQLIQLGIKPIVIDRGVDVRSRRRHLAELNKSGILNEESNYCYGEGGAGTYSDGKLYTRSTKRGNVQRILQLFVQFGAADTILYEAHPHIGTNKLPQIITAIRACIESCGGEVLFTKKLTDLNILNGTITSIKTSDGDTLTANAYILATGHSARDIYELLHKKNIQISAKPFALGVRVEHPQALIDSMQYKCTIRNALLPPASYSLVQQVQGRGVFSFCMCPGGIVAAASTANNELVVNGWSPSKRNNLYANSGMVVSLDVNDLKGLKNYTTYFNNENTQQSPLALLNFQKIVEQKAYVAGGGKFVAPAQRLVDYVQHKVSTNLPTNSYIPGTSSANLHEVLPPFISQRLANALQQFGKTMKGYYTNDAILIATESRTSSPVSIPRNKETLQHPQLSNLYPCGEGAGYAGGIVSACIDGENCAKAIAAILL